MFLLRDKYLLTAIAAVLIVLAVCVLDVREPSSDTDITGVASNIRQSEKGYTFDLTDDKGETIRCYFSGEIEENAVYTVSGRFSDDGNILFISRIVR